MSLEYNPQHAHQLLDSFFESIDFVCSGLGDRLRSVAREFAPIGSKAASELRDESASTDLGRAWNSAVDAQDGGPGHRLLAMELGTFNDQLHPWLGSADYEHVGRLDGPSEKPTTAFLKRMAGIGKTLVGSILSVLGDFLSEKWKAVLEVVKEILDVLAG